MKRIILLTVLFLCLTACASRMDISVATEPVNTEMPTVSVAETEPVNTEMPTVSVAETEPVNTEIPTLPAAETEPPMQTAENITFSYEYITKENVMAYGLFTPSIAEDAEELPLIVFLHGYGENNQTNEWFAGAGLPYALNNWPLDGFGAYVICPHLRNRFYTRTWNNPKAANNVISLIEDFAADHNVDRDNIIIGGFSLGGAGAFYLACEYPEYFSKIVVMSAICPMNADYTQIDIPGIGCIEMTQSDFHFINDDFASFFGAENVRKYDTHHEMLPCAAFIEDKDQNNQSDLVEWLFPADSDSLS